MCLYKLNILIVIPQSLLIILVLLIFNLIWLIPLKYYYNVTKYNILNTFYKDIRIVYNVTSVLRLCFVYDQYV